MENKTKTAEEIISTFIECNYDNPDDASELPEGDYIEESKFLKAMEIYAKQESDKAVSELKEELLNFITKATWEEDSNSEIINDIIERLNL
jgi:hypothetical protein